MSNKKIVVWCGSAPNQRALVNKIHARFPLAGIVIDTGHTKAPKRPLSSIPARIIDRIRFKKIYAAWQGLMSGYQHTYPDWPDVPTIKVSGINDPATLAFTNEQQPDLVVVSGTALVKGALLELALPIGIINLHTGLSPYVKGGPNCTNWCIANNDWHLVGNTIMWLNAGIDAGNIITSATIDIRTAKDLREAQHLVMEHAHALYIDTIDYLLQHTPPYPSVPQTRIGKAALYLTKMWTPAKRKALLKNWRRRNGSPHLPDPVTIALPKADQR